MASIFRKIMRNITRNNARRETLSGSSALVGTRRAGMHQAAEHEYQRAVLASDEHHPETVEDALDMPGALEEEIPPVEEEDDEIVEEIAEGDAVISGETEILEEIADPEASVVEETVETEEILSKRRQMAVDYSAEKIPVLEPVTGGIGVPADTPLEYSSGDGSLKEIQEPLPGLGEKLGIPPLFNGVADPSANVAAYEEPEPQPEPEPPAEDVPAEVPGD